MSRCPHYVLLEESPCLLCRSRADEAEIARLEARIAELEAEQELMRGLAFRLTEALARAETAEARIARVEALMARWDGLRPTIMDEMVDVAAVIRAALSGEEQ